MLDILKEFKFYNALILSFMKNKSRKSTASLSLIYNNPYIFLFIKYLSCPYIFMRLYIYYCFILSKYIIDNNIIAVMSLKTV